MPATITIPDERINQVGLTLRRASNEFHGAIAREPESLHVAAWRETATWYDEMASRLLGAHVHVSTYTGADGKPHPIINL